MITSEIIKTLNTQNIAGDNKKKVTEFMEEYWDKTPSQKKKHCIALGGYIDARPFWQTKNTGKISCRMAVCISLGLEPRINPFFIIGESDDKEYSDEKLIEFLKQKGFKDIAEEIGSRIDLRGTKSQDENSLDYMVQEFRNTVKNSLSDIQNDPEISIDDLLTLLKNLEIKVRISNDESSNAKLKLIKAILISK